MGTVVGVCRHPHLLEPCRCPLGGGGARGARGPETEGDVVEGVEVGEESRVLCQKCDAARVRWDPGVGAGVGEGAPADLHGPGVGAEEADRGGKDGRLAGAVGTEQRDGGALGHAEVDGDVSVGDGEGQREGRAHGVPAVSESRRVRVSPMTSTATATRTSERATAARGSASRWR